MLTAVFSIIPVAHRSTFNHRISKKDIYRNSTQHKDEYKPFTASSLTTEDYPAVPALLLVSYIIVRPMTMIFLLPLLTLYITLSYRIYTYTLIYY